MTKNINNSKLVFVLLIVSSLIIGMTTGLLIKGCGTGTHMMSHEAAQENEEKILFLACSMHPQIKQKTSGPCPICGMDLTPMKEDAGGGDKASLTLGKRARQLASVKTTPAVLKNLTKSIYTVGKINYDESKISHVTSWVNGRIDELYVNFTGTIVQKGEHLVYIYSPELVSTQDEYLIAYRGSKILQKSSIFEGMYVKTGDMLFTIADLSRVWLYLDIYEYDIPWIKYGQDVEVTTESYPGEIFHGTVVFIDPFLDEDTRTVRVRVNMDNREGKLKPGMFANVVIKSRFGAGGIIFDPDIAGKYMCPMHPDIVSGKQGDCPECGMDLELVGSGRQNGLGLQMDNTKSSIQNQRGVLAVPHSAVLYTGLRNLVYVEVEEGNYMLREVKLGPKADEYYYVISGLKPGERVVTSAIINSPNRWRRTQAKACDYREIAI